MAAQPHDSVDVPQSSLSLEELLELVNDNLLPGVDAPPSTPEAYTVPPLTEAGLLDSRFFTESNPDVEDIVLKGTKPSDVGGHGAPMEQRLDVVDVNEEEVGSPREEMGEQLRSLLLDLLHLENGTNTSPPDESDALWLKLKQLDQEVHDAATLGQILSPVLTQLIAHHAAQSPEQLAKALSQVADRMIQLQVQQDPAAMSTALATAIPGAISRQLGDAPDEIVQAIAPAMGQAITAQIRLNQDSMIDALYPVIGSTISKYMGEVANQINQRLEATLSPKRLIQRLWLRWQGISEAELILRDAVPFQVQAAFLIHKASGLVMAEVQQASAEPLEGDLLAGMLTAIRGFASECTTAQAHHSELSKINYDDFQIVMEVAGSCYIAAVVQGEPPTDFLVQLRQILSAMILNYGYGTQLESYNGDPATIPTGIQDLLTTLVQTPGLAPNTPTSPLIPPHVLQKALGFLAIVGLVLGGGFYWYLRQQALGQRVLQTFRATPALAVYRLDAQVRWGQVHLSGTVPSPALKIQAEQLARQVLPRHRLDSTIETPTVPPPPEVVQGHAQQVANALNQTLNLQLTTAYNPAQQQLTVQTPDLHGAQLQQVTQAMEQITGVRSLVFKVVNAINPLEQRIYFETNATQLASSDRQQTLMQLAQYLQANPNIALNVIGHTDQSGEERYNQQLARQRAMIVQQSLVKQGIAASRLFVRGDTNMPPGVLANDPMNQSRCVRFEVVNLEE